MKKSKLLKKIWWGIGIIFIAINGLWFWGKHAAVKALENLYAQNNAVFTYRSLDVSGYPFALCIKFEDPMVKLYAQGTSHEGPPYLEVSSAHEIYTAYFWRPLTFNVETQQTKISLFIDALIPSESRELLKGLQIINTIGEIMGSASLTWTGSLSGYNVALKDMTSHIGKTTLYIHHARSELAYHILTPAHLKTKAGLTFDDIKVQAPLLAAGSLDITKIILDLNADADRSPDTSHLKTLVLNGTLQVDALGAKVEGVFDTNQTFGEQQQPTKSDTTLHLTGQNLEAFVEYFMRTPSTMMLALLIEGVLQPIKQENGTYKMDVSVDESTIKVPALNLTIPRETGATPGAPATSTTPPV